MIAKTSLSQHLTHTNASQDQNTHAAAPAAPATPAAPAAPAALVATIPTIVTIVTTLTLPVHFPSIESEQMC